MKVNVVKLDATPQFKILCKVYNAAWPSWPVRCLFTFDKAMFFFMNFVFVIMSKWQQCPPSLYQTILIITL